MAREKKASKRKRSSIALPWGAAGVSLAMAGSVSAAVAPPEKAPTQPTAQPPVLPLSEEELSDVNLSTFFVFARETIGARGEQYAQRRCGGCRGCHVGGRCGGGRCAVAGCGGRCGGGCAVVRRCGGCAVVACAGCARC